MVQRWLAARWNDIKGHVMYALLVLALASMVAILRAVWHKLAWWELVVIGCGIMSGWTVAVAAMLGRRKLSSQLDAPIVAALATEEPSLESNLVLSCVYPAPVYFFFEEWLRYPPPGGQRGAQLRALCAEITNLPTVDQTVAAARDIRAELVIGTESFSPLVWLDTASNSVDIELGSVHYLLLAVCMSPEDWRVVVNGHEIDFGCPLIEREQTTARLNLLSVKTESILRSYDGYYVWQHGKEPSLAFEQKVS